MKNKDTYINSERLSSYYLIYIPFLVCFLAICACSGKQFWDFMGASTSSDKEDPSKGATEDVTVEWVDPDAELVSPDDPGDPGGGPGGGGAVGSLEDPEPFECLGTGIETRALTGFLLEMSNPPEVYTYANVEEHPPLEGIQVSFSEGSTGYGRNRILWQAGDWIEVSTSEPFSTIGVQMHGDATVGQARVLFDGVEVWRGTTAVQWVEERYALYVEVGCFAPGAHTLRIESLGLDGGGGGESVSVSYFGFRR
jgi:hypothetical protein